MLDDLGFGKEARAFVDRKHQLLREADAAFYDDDEAACVMAIEKIYEFLDDTLARRSIGTVRRRGA